jgi:hypothetical protein
MTNMEAEKMAGIGRAMRRRIEAPVMEERQRGPERAHKMTVHPPDTSESSSPF